MNFNKDLKLEPLKYYEDAYDKHFKQLWDIRGLVNLINDCSYDYLKKDGRNIHKSLEKKEWKTSPFQNR